MDAALDLIKKFIPRNLFLFFQPAYHFLLSFLGTLIYGFPSKKLTVIAVTGSKGKTTTTELVNTILEKAGYKTVVANTVRFKVGDTSVRNTYKMTMPGRFFLQRLLWKGLRSGCTHAVIEMSSEGAKQFRHRFIDLDALIFTNLEKEHIEAHGSYEKYVEAKLDIARQLLRGKKKLQTLILNRDEGESERFAALRLPHTLWYGLSDAEPFEVDTGSTSFMFRGMRIETSLIGRFNLSNMLAAATLAESLGVSKEVIKAGLESFIGVAGRVEKVDAGQDFEVIVDYAHTPNSLENLYQAFSGRHTICVLSGTGGGRDTWKRPVMGEIADRYCSEIILTDEDPYDEDPNLIVEEIAKGISKHRPTIIMDRREAIAEALSRAKVGDVVLLTGKGTDPYIMGPSGSKQVWNEAAIAKEEINKILAR